jgi:5-methylcytosine-specific restriction endonuclease McrA
MKKAQKSYYAENKNHILNIQEVYRNSAIGAYRIITRRAKKHNLPLCSKEEFIEWYAKTPKVCSYCDLDEKFMGRVEKRKTHLTLDKLIPRKGYTLDNIVFACRRCNLTKSNFFTAEEMKQIAQKYIKPRFEKQIKSPLKTS